MKIALLAAAVLASSPALADDARPYVTYGGRGVSSNAQAAKPLGPDTIAAPAAPSGGAGITAATTPGGAFGSNSVTTGILTAAGVDPTARPSASQGVRGGKRGLVGGSRRSVRAATSGGASSDAPPPYYDKPGALIRTAGQQPKYADPHDATTHAVDGGGFVTINDARAHDVGRGPGITYGPPDTLPGANPGTSSGSGAGGNAVTSNSKGGSSGGNGDSNGDSHSDDGHGHAKDSSATLDLSF